MMKMIKSFACVFFIMISTACKEKKGPVSTTDNEPTSIEETTTEANTNSLVLKEDALGDFELKKGMPLETSTLANHFPNIEIKKGVGQQDGPDYLYYTIGEDVTFSTPDTKDNVLSHVSIKGNSEITDVYGIGIGNTLTDIKNKRSNIKIMTEHFHIYLYEDASKISYEMSLTDYNGPDKQNYTFDDLGDSKVIAIIWGR